MHRTWNQRSAFILLGTRTPKTSCPHHPPTPQPASQGSERSCVGSSILPKARGAAISHRDLAVLRASLPSNLRASRKLYSGRKHRRRNYTKQNVSRDWESLGAPAGARLKGIGSTPPLPQHLVEGEGGLLSALASVALLLS